MNYVALLCDRIEHIARNVAGYMNERNELLEIADQVRRLEEAEHDLKDEVEALMADLDNAHDGRNREAAARCDAEDRLRVLEAREQARWPTFERSCTGPST